MQEDGLGQVGWVWFSLVLFRVISLLFGERSVFVKSWLILFQIFCYGWFCKKLAHPVSNILLWVEIFAKDSLGFYNKTKDSLKIRYIDSCSSMIFCI